MRQGRDEMPDFAGELQKRLRQRATRSADPTRLAGAMLCKMARGQDEKPVKYV
jgi:hypothetical protein